MRDGACSVSGAALFFALGLLALLGVFGAAPKSSHRQAVDALLDLHNSTLGGEGRTRGGSINVGTTGGVSRYTLNSVKRGKTVRRVPMSPPRPLNRNTYEELFSLSLSTEPREPKDNGIVRDVPASLPQFHDVTRWQDMPADDFDSRNHIRRKSKNAVTVTSNILRRSDYDGDVEGIDGPELFLTLNYGRIPSRRSKRDRFAKRVFAAAVAQTRWSETMKSSVIGYKYGTLDRAATVTERIYACRIEKKLHERDAVCIRCAPIVKGNQHDDRDSDQTTGTESTYRVRNDRNGSSRSVRARGYRPTSEHGSPSPESCDARTAST
jgi:hypothetical protein